MDLLSKGSIGPGFSVSGTMTEGITVGSLQENGPAKDCGKISLGMYLLFCYSAEMIKHNRYKDIQVK